MSADRVTETVRNREEEPMNEKESIKRVSLCPACGACPEVALDLKQEEVQIGEPGNLVRLNREAWNALVEKIQAGELKRI